MHFKLYTNFPSPTQQQLCFFVSEVKCRGFAKSKFNVGCFHLVLVLCKYVYVHLCGIFFNAAVKLQQQAMQVTYASARQLLRSAFTQPLCLSLVCVCVDVRPGQRSVAFNVSAVRSITFRAHSTTIGRKQLL